MIAVILQDTYTLSQLKHKLNVLKSYLLHTFFGASLNLPPADLTWLESLPLMQNFTKDNAYDLIDQLQKQTSQLKVLIVYLTFEPDEATTAQIGRYARRAFSDSLLLDIKIDPSLIAGTALVWKGIYKDYSLKALIEERKGEIAESFKKYLR